MAPPSRYPLAIVGAGALGLNFAARLTAPVAQLADAPAIAGWLKQHPNGLLIGRMDQSPLPWPPRELVTFRNREWGLWSAADQKEP